MGRGRGNSRNLSMRHTTKNATQSGHGVAFFVEWQVSGPRNDANAFEKSAAGRKDAGRRRRRRPTHFPAKSLCWRASGGLPEGAVASHSVYCFSSDARPGGLPLTDSSPRLTRCGNRVNVNCCRCGSPRFGVHGVVIFVVLPTPNSRLPPSARSSLGPADSSRRSTPTAPGSAPIGGIMG